MESSEFFLNKSIAAGSFSDFKAFAFLHDKAPYIGIDFSLSCKLYDFVPLENFDDDNVFLIVIPNPYYE